MRLIDLMYPFNKKAYRYSENLYFNLALATYMSIIFCQHKNDTTTRERSPDLLCDIFKSSGCYQQQ